MPERPTNGALISFSEHSVVRGPSRPGSPVCMSGIGTEGGAPRGIRASDEVTAKTQAQPAGQTSGPATFQKFVKYRHGDSNERSHLGTKSGLNQRPSQGSGDYRAGIREAFQREAALVLYLEGGILF